MRKLPPQLFLILIILALGPCVGAQQHFFPFFAEINEDNVNVRAGQSKNFEQLCQLNKGEAVIVVDINYSWYKIQLPSRAKVYISEKYVLKQKGDQGIVVGDRVNLRAGPGIDYSVLGQVEKDSLITITGSEDGFYQILPVKEAYGWVKEDYLTYKSGTVDPQP